MNIEIDGAHKSTVTCWRELLRHLNTLNSSDLSGGKYKNLPQTNFVAFGASNSELMDEILRFMLADLPIDSETRTEIFLNNLKDAVCLNLFNDPPEDAFVQKEDPKAKAILQKQIIDVKVQLKQVKMNILLFDSDEYVQKVNENHKKDILERHLTNFENDLDKMHPFVVEQPYIAWVIKKLLEKSALDCQQIIDASNRVSESSFSELHRSYINSVGVEHPPTDTLTTSAHKTSI